MVKFDSRGNLKFAVQAGSVNGDCAYSIAIDSKDFVYIVGYAGGTIDGQPWPKIETTYDMIFIQKYDSNGQRLWTRLSGAVTDINTMESNFGYGVRMGTHLDQETPLLTGIVTASSSSGRRYDSVLRMYDSAGNILWAKQASCGLTCSVSAYALAVSNSTGAATIAGAAFGPYGAQKYIGGGDYVLAQFPGDEITNQAAQPEWVVEGGSDSLDRANAVVLNQKTGDIFITGSIQVVSKPYIVTDMFVAKATQN